MIVHDAIRRQRGVTLIITLVMLVVLTLFAVSAMRLSNVNLKITGNYQWQKEMEALTDSALEQVNSSANSFDNAAVQNGTAVAQDICADGTVVASGGCPAFETIGTISVPRCTGNRPAEGYTIKQGELSPDDTDWVINAEATDSLSGAKIRITRGTKVRLLAGHCPN